MRIKKIILVTIVLFFAAVVSAQGVVIPMSDVIEMHNGKSYYVHTVYKGQTVYSIAKAYDVTPDEIYFENPGAKQGVNINQTLLIPTVNKDTELKNEVVATNYDFFYHVAAKDETFDHLSSIYLIPKKYIVKANPDLKVPLREGEYVKVPVEEAFDILDGKTTRKAPVASNRTVNTNRYNPEPTRKPATTPTTSDTQTTPKPEKKQTVEPTSETISFNPDIPVIQDYRHVVILGETTQSIADKYGVPVETLKSANPGLGNYVEKGDRLRVPDKTKIDTTAKKQDETVNEPKIQDITIVDDTASNHSPSTTEVETIKHKVKKKETLYSIGREYGVTVTELMDANKGLTTTIKVGQIILVPKKKISTPYIIHKVEYNTKVNKIARLYRIPVYQIKEFNPTLGKRVYQNQEVKIPVGSKAIISPVLPIDYSIQVENEESVLDYGLVNTYHNDCDFSPDKNRVFKVALMIPLSLEEADSLNVEQFLMSYHPFFTPFRFIQFYEGALIALDSLTKKGMKVDMYVYDVDKNLTKTAKVLQQRELRSMDIIIGPFYSNSFNQVALFAGNFNIPIVNPMSFRENIVNNYSTVIKVKPNTSYQTNMISTFINRFDKRSKVFLISQTSYVNADKVIEIKNNITSTLEPQVKFSNEDLYDLAYSVAERDTLFDGTTQPPPFILEGTEIFPDILENTLTDSTIINNYLTRINYATDSLYPFLENASPLRNNLIILYGTKKSFILDVLNRLNESKDTFDIKLIGVPSWERISNLSNVKMNNLNLSYFTTNYIDYKHKSTQNFIDKFRSNYSTDPNNFAFAGFDITYYFLNSLYYLGDGFNNCIEYFPMELLQSGYHYRRIGNTNNFENDYWHMLQFENLSIIKIPDSIILPDKQTNIYD